MPRWPESCRRWRITDTKRAPSNERAPSATHSPSMTRVHCNTRSLLRSKADLRALCLVEASFAEKDVGVYRRMNLKKHRIQRRKGVNSVVREREESSGSSEEHLWID